MRVSSGSPAEPRADSEGGSFRIPVSQSNSTSWRIAAAIGVIAGLASGLLGVGGGFLIVPLQVIWLGSSQRRTSGTSLAAIFPIASVGVAVYAFGASRPQIDLPVAIALSIAAAPER